MLKFITVQRFEKIKKRIYIPRLPNGLADPGPCWLTNYSPTGGGYIRLKFEGKSHPLHRITWQIENGFQVDDIIYLAELPDYYEDMDHLCDNRPCINPKHVEPVTRSENLKRAFQRGTKSNHGLNNPRAKFSDETVALARNLRNQGVIYREITEQTGISKPHLHSIFIGKTRVN